MARIRTIKPEFWTDERIVQLPFQARLLFIGLWNFCDDQGCITDSPEKIRLQVLPADREVDIEECLDLLVSCGLLEILINEDGLRAFHVLNWSKHQKIDNPAKPKILDGSYKKMAIPSEARRGIAKKYRCVPGASVSAECYFCGSPGMIHWHKLSSGRPSAWVSFSGLEIDHLVPESKGGESASENLVLSCRGCNRGRNNKSHIEFIFSGKAEEQQFLATPRYSSPPEGKGREGNVREGILPPTPQGAEEENPHLFKDPDTRRFFPMPLDWQPDPAELQKYINGKMHAGKPITIDAVLCHLSEFRDATSAKGQSRTEAQWCLALVQWTMKCLNNPKPPDKQNNPEEQQAKQPYRPVSTPNPFAHMSGPRDPALAARARQDQKEKFGGR